MCQVPITRAHLHFRQIVMAHVSLLLLPKGIQYLYLHSHHVDGSTAAVQWGNPTPFSDVTDAHLAKSGGRPRILKDTVWNDLLKMMFSTEPIPLQCLGGF